MAESSSPDVDASVTTTRTSTRVRRHPDTYASSPVTNGKRKRTAGAEEDVDMDAEDASDDEEDEDDEDEPDEEELRERARRARKTKRASKKQPAPKKARVNDLALPIRAARGPPKKRAARKAKDPDREGAEAAGGIYADLFARDKAFDEVTSEWMQAFQEHESSAFANLVNFALKAAGCNAKVTAHDMEDPDSATPRMSDLQDEYQASQPTDYPLIAKGKNASALRDTICGFIRTLIKSLMASGLLWDNVQLIENIHEWYCTMSSATNRAFRHTATVLCLDIVTSLCEVAKELAEKAAINRRHAETERKKPRANKERVKQLENKVQDASKHLAFVDSLLSDWFDTVFIHRYRDVDAIIRRECVAALGQWIITMPDTFFDGQHLRYLGWLLSDSNAATRLEDLKQLRRLYSDRDKLGGLKTFTERFRERFVEIATSDAEPAVRVAGIELLHVLRASDLLEPDDIDAAGRLIFHDDVRTRKAIAPFFAENVNDLYNAKIDELGGSESVQEALPEVSEDAFDVPRPAWLKFKSLAEMMASYDQEDGKLPDSIERDHADGSLRLHAAAVESRFTLAVDALYGQVEELLDWQVLAGYLLFDCSVTQARKRRTDPLLSLKRECALSESEVLILLEVLNASASQTFKDAAEKLAAPKVKLAKRQKEDLLEGLEDQTRALVDLIPKLLKKFGDVPNTAAAVLRLEGVLALPSLENLHQDSSTGAALLNDLSKQFMSHGTDEVLAPATLAILHAKSYGELDDTAAEKLSTLWDDVVGNLAELLDVATITVRGASRNEELLALSNNLQRIVRLSTISDCTSSLEDSNYATSDESTGKDYRAPIDFIIDLIQRAMPSKGPAPDPDDAALEDQVASRAAEASVFYFRWKLAAIMPASAAETNGRKDKPTQDSLVVLAERQNTFASNTEQALKSRKSGQQVTVSLAGELLDMYTSIAVLRTAGAKSSSDLEAYMTLVPDFDRSCEQLVMKVFVAVEQEYAKLARKSIAKAVEVSDDVDADPIDADPASDSESDVVDDGQPTQASQQRQIAKKMLPLLAEQTLCRLASRFIFATLAGVLSDPKTRARLQLNKAKLGANFKEVLAYLDAGTKPQAKTKAKAKSDPVVANGTSRRKPAPKSNAIVADDEEDDDIEDVDVDDEEEEEQAPGIDVDDKASESPAEESVLGD